MQQHVLIIGAGALGTSLGGIISSEHAAVSYWDIDASKCPGGCAPLESTVPTVDVIFLCVPSGAMRTAVTRISALVPSLTPIVTLAKGIEAPSGLAMYQVCEELLPKHCIVVMSGAMLAHELASGLPGMALIASSSDDCAHKVSSVFDGSPLRTQITSDMRSVSYAGVLKNIYAIMMGMGDGLALGGNARGWLFSQAVREMIAIARHIRIDREIILSIAGIGDLVATGISKHSKNHTAGVELARSGVTHVSCEGITSLMPILQMIGHHPDLILLNALESILVDHHNVREVIHRLLYESQ